MEEVTILGKAIEAQLHTSLEPDGSRQYPWGSLYCLYDPKGGATSAGINYTFGVAAHLK
jgi:hypothetical protein